MWWKSTFKTERGKPSLLPKKVIRRTLPVLLALTLAAASISAQITVVYPKPGQTIGAVDSTFIFGHLPPGSDPESSALEINGHDVAVHEDGGFLAFLPIEPGEFVFQLQVTGPNQFHDSLTVMVPKPRVSLGPDSMAIVGAYRPPGGDIDLISGDRLAVSFQGTPGCRAWFSIDGVLDSVPMSERDPRTQPYWDEAVFGAGAVPDSLMIRGIYSGFIDIADSVRVDSARITYHLAPPSMKEVAVRLFGPDSEYAPRFDLFSYLRLVRTDSTVSRLSHYVVSLNSRDYPFTVRFADSVQIVRHGPRKGYLSIFQPEGVEALAVGGEGNWYKLRLSHSQTGWVNKESVEPLARGFLPPHSYLRSIRTYNYRDRVSIQFPLAGKHPFRVVEDDARTIRIQLFGVTSDTDWIRYDFSDTLVELATWSQLEPGLYEFRLHLTRDLWGYDTYYRGTTLCLDLMRAPEKLWTIRGKRIVIDPGHSHDLGAVGPTGYTRGRGQPRDCPDCPARIRVAWGRGCYDPRRRTRLAAI